MNNPLCKYTRPARGALQLDCFTGEAGGWSAAHYQVVEIFIRSAERGPLRNFDALVISFRLLYRGDVISRRSSENFLTIRR